MTQRLQNITLKGVENNKDPNLLAIGLRLLSKQLESKASATAYLQQHRRKCHRPACCCRNSELNNRPDLLLRQHFEGSAVKLADDGSSVLR
jgi:hypothetical protein